VLDDELKGDAFRFHAGVSYRHIMIWDEGKAEMATTPPHDILGRKIDSYLPSGEGADEILIMMENAREILKKKALGGSGKYYPNAIWLWGQGRAPDLPEFKEIYGLEGAIISAVDLVKGIGICAGMELIAVPGATGYLDTNYRGKGEYAVKGLGDFDFVYVHVEAPDEAAHSGSASKKVEAIEAFDREVVGRIIEGMSKLGGPFAIMVLPDHATPISKRTHTGDPVPFAIYGSEPPWARKNSGRPFDEESASKEGLFVEKGHSLLGRFILGKW
jgi:2,3-bisphosphoglycerate-independent phosphoglycerate mutase